MNNSTSAGTSATSTVATAAPKLRGAGTASLVRGVVAGSLLVNAVVTVVSILLMPDFSGSAAESLAAIAEAGTTATVSAIGFTASQLFLAIGLLGVAHLVRARVPVLAGIGYALVLLGAFGHAVYGGVNLVMLVMAEGLGAVEVHAGVLERTEQGALPLLAAGLLGTVVGFILLGAAVWRSGMMPRWVGPAMIVWVLLEFVGSTLSPWATYASGALYVAVFAALALSVVRSSIGHWQTAAEAGQEL